MNFPPLIRLTFDTKDRHSRGTAWDGSPQSLVALMARISAAGDEAQASQVAVSSAVAVLGAEFAVLISEGSLVCAAGVAIDEEGLRQLTEAAWRGLAHSSLPNVGAVDLASAAVTDEVPSWLIVGRPHRAAFTSEQTAVLDGIARVLALRLRVARAAEEGRGLRQRGENEMRQRKRAERELAHRALHDPLTGLPNRSLLSERTDQALQRAGLVAALFVDIDHFKLANDALDHRRGDKLLELLSRRLGSVLALEENGTYTCTLGRPGGDEFIVLCEDLETERNGVAVAQQIHDALRPPFFVDGQEFLLTASVGIACAVGEAAQALDADALFRDAEMALSRAKEHGRDRYEIFDEQMRVRLLDRVALESDLRAGLERNELRLLYQPVVTVSDASLAAVEALVRWQHPTRGLLGPGEFIPVAEESDLIVSLGTWVLDEACDQMRRWREAHPAELSVRVSVNVSARQLSPALVDTVSAALERNSIPPSQLALEITESLLIEHTEASVEVLAALTELGVSIVLDDFGTGYSSLGYLNEFPLGQLKLDRSFTSELASDARSAKIVAATIDMARALGMTVVAEGVETVEQLEVLRRLGCDYAQGFLFARPEQPDNTFARIRGAYEHDQEIASQRASSARFSPSIATASARTLDDPHRRQQVVIGRLAGWLFLIGSILAIPSDLVMGAPSPPAVAALTLMGVLTGLACLTVPWHLVSARGLNAIAVVATTEITISVIVVGRHGVVLQPIYLLIATAVAYAFRDRRVIAGHVAYIVVAMTVPLAFASGKPALALPLTLVAIIVLVSMSAVIAYLRETLEGSAAELRELASRDPLTDVGNYRLLHERLDYELIRHKRDTGQLAVLLIDLDRFKQVNQRRGHAAGDDVLRRVALTLSEAVRQQDTVARQGGDEFAVLAPNTDAEGAAMLASRIRDRLSRIQFAGETIGATIGFAVYPAEGVTANDLLARADEALMNGKLEPGQPHETPAGRLTPVVPAPI